MISLFLALALLQEPAEQPPLPDVIKVTTADEVAAWVAFDLATIPEEDRGNFFYLWLPPWSKAEHHYSYSWAVNTVISRAGTIQKPAILFQGWLQRWDLRQLVPDRNERRKVAAVLRDLIARDPYFRCSESSPFFTESGLLPVVEERAAPLLRSMGLRDVPVMRGDFAFDQMTTCLNGGQYLELRGLSDVVTGPANPTPELAALALFGVFPRQSFQVDGDLRVGLDSRVSYNPRIVEALKGLVGRAWITHDMSRNDLSPDKDMMYNLLFTKPAGHEIILEMRNGLHLFLVTDDKGNILKQAPDHVVTDRLVAHVTQSILDAGPMSCSRCHASGGGLVEAPNEVSLMLQGNASVLVDLGLAEDEDAASEIAARYSGRAFDRELERGREDYANAIDEITEGTMTVEELMNQGSEIYAEYRYNAIDSARALEELGYRIRPFGPRAHQVFIQMTLPLEQPAANLSIVELPEKLRLDAGLTLSREQFDRAYPIFLERMRLRGF